MPGPCSEPAAKTPTGVVIYGKTRLRRAGLTSRSGMTARDWGTPRADTRRAPEHDRTRDHIDRIEEATP